MIKCNRCGKMTPAGAVCQACGAPLAGMVDNGPAPRMGFQDQPELPAWLESLRAGERTATPTNNATSFSPADLIEDGALPSWMRAERGGMSVIIRLLIRLSLPLHLNFQIRHRQEGIFLLKGLLHNH
ncbi:hypothetical protein [Dictyobacter kobayashii]|uniref:hypothetical protein n=1 Tax=Dictyobacter kobayashii TaxID=2014872 RepID=UPI000F835A30|nr:hypothetical protein [Dictyobacter kobayashii]